MTYLWGVLHMGQARAPWGRSIALSELESRCIRLYGAGWTRDEISRMAHVSPRTVGAALTVAKEKLGARSLAHAAILISSQSSAESRSYDSTAWPTIARELR